MSDCKPCSTPVDTQAKVSFDKGAPVSDPIAYRSLAGALQYLTFTRPNTAYAVHQVCLHMHDPCEPHLTATKRAPSTMACFFNATLRRTSSSTLMLTEPVVPTLAGPLRATRYSWVTTSSPGPQSINMSSLVRALRRSTVSWPTARAGYRAGSASARYSSLV
jgi:hypothetical protein